MIDARDISVGTLVSARFSGRAVPAKVIAIDSGGDRTLLTLISLSTSKIRTCRIDAWDLEAVLTTYEADSWVWCLTEARVMQMQATARYNRERNNRNGFLSRVV